MMEQLVVDASVVVSWIVPEQSNAVAQELLSQSLQRGSRLIAPDHLPMEVANTLTKLFRRNLLSETQIREAYDLFSGFRPIIHPIAPMMDRAFDLSITYRISFWDAAYVALSEVERCGLVTADERLYRAIGRSFLNIRLL